ncbi:MAG: 5-methyltetrahydropteroyltriglutamate--homocysteine methyltransferase [Betaproteobacteria bacterium]|jgi:5-methyltetrahydropteroyltriglutamate--homocysteine methyltransferase|nr:5-methyltetrahydropteroyltriglutamate--homocysteine methyltransferase [Betaproteobacteria bacterium]
MYIATANVVLPTTIIGSLPRPGWYTQNLGRREFREAMVDRTYREQYLDAVSTYLRDQEVAGLDIVTDGDCRFDADVAGHNWFSYAPLRMSGFSGANFYRAGGKAGFPHKPGHILHDVLETRMMPDLTGPVGRGTLQYTAVWKAAQRLTTRPVKFGTIMPELIAMAVRDQHYKDLKKSILAISDALNEELHELADAGCKVIQMEEPQIHLLAAKGLVDKVLNPDFMVEVFNNTVRGLRAKTEIWCHTCWGNPAAQRLFAKTPSYAPAIEPLSRIDADVITFETCSSGGMDLEAIGKGIKDKKICIGVVDHHTLQVETPEQVAVLVRKALEHVPAERLILGSDCGMGREGMSRRHAFYKMVSIVQGTNLVRRERKLPEAACLAADEKFSMVEAL